MCFPKNLTLAKNIFANDPHRKKKVWHGNTFAELFSQQAQEMQNSQKFSTLKITQYTVLDQTIIHDVQNLTFSLLIVDLFLFYNVF